MRHKAGAIGSLTLIFKGVEIVTLEFGAHTMQNSEYEVVNEWRRRYGKAFYSPQVIINKVYFNSDIKVKYYVLEAGLNNMSQEVDLSVKKFEREKAIKKRYPKPNKNVSNRTYGKLQSIAHNRKHNF